MPRKVLPMVSAAVTAVLLVSVVSVGHAGYILSKCTLETCSSTDGLSTDYCDSRLSVLYSVVSGQNNTDAIQLMFDGVENDDDGVSSSAAAIENKELTVTIQKTPIYFQYPTTYDETYNYQAYELVAYGTTDSDGSFSYFNDNPLNFEELNYCVDSDDAEAPSCGYATDRCVCAQVCCERSVFDTVRSETPN